VTVRAQQPQDESPGTAQSQPASQSSVGLKENPHAFHPRCRRQVRRSDAPFRDRTNDLCLQLWARGRPSIRATLNLRRRGVDESSLTNSIVDNHPLFAGIERRAGASIGVSYLFHRTGHHQLERWTSIVHFGVATGGAARNYALKRPHHP